MDVTRILRESTIFNNLSEEALDAVAGQMVPVSYQAGEAILREGETGDCYFVIADGEVVLSKGRGIAHRELGRLSARQGFGEMALVSNRPRSATVKALVDTNLYRLDRAGFDVLIKQEHRFAQNILSFISGRLLSSDEQAEHELVRAYQGLIMSLSQLAESRDPETGGHLFRVRDYCVLLAKRLSCEPQYAFEVTGDFIDAVCHVSPLHDIGKVGIRDEILLKPGKLTPDEFAEMKQHSTIGSEALRTVIKFTNHPMFQVAEHIVRSHHERFDGTGYPDGLAGEDIPLEARIMSLADVYDALRSVRPYKKAFEHDEAMAIMRDGMNKAFDPAIGQIMLENSHEFAQIHEQYSK